MHVYQAQPLPGACRAASGPHHWEITSRNSRRLYRPQFRAVETDLQEHLYVEAQHTGFSARDTICLCGSAEELAGSQEDSIASAENLITTVSQISRESKKPCSKFENAEKGSATCDSGDRRSCSCQGVGELVQHHSFLYHPANVHPKTASVSRCSVFFSISARPLLVFKIGWISC